MCLPLVRASERSEICQAWWHTLVTLDTLESHIGRLWFKASRTKMLARPYLKNQASVVGHTIIPATKEVNIGDYGAPGKNTKLPEK
jgi:hypothetical protein